MYTIIALGNPGEQYHRTRHNVGWIVLDMILSEPDWQKHAYAHAVVTTAHFGDQVVTIAKPQTFMNESGKTAGYFIDKEHVQPDQLIVVYDDLDLPLGKYKISFDRGSGGHNGIKSIEEQLGSREFIRIRIGISRVLENGELIKPNVLGNFESDELETLKNLAPKISSAIATILKEGKETAMTTFNNQS